MKIILLAFFACVISHSAFAQDQMPDSSKKGMSEMGMSKMGMSKMGEGAMMMDGKMMSMKHGMMKPMTHPMTMSNGTTVTPDGMIKMKNGKMMHCKEGYCVMKSGQIKKSSMKKGMGMAEDMKM